MGKPLGPSRHSSPPAEPTGFLLWAKTLVLTWQPVMARGFQRAPQSKDLATGVVGLLLNIGQQVLHGWLPAAQAIGNRPAALGDVFLHGPWSLQLLCAIQSSSEGFFSVSLPAACLQTEGHHLHPHPKCQEHHRVLHGQDLGAGSGGL